MDDLIVFSDKKYHAHYLAFVIKILNKHNLGARPVKCDLGRERISFVGHYVDGDGLHIDPAKVTAITEMPYPSDKGGIRRFLGMYRFVEVLYGNSGNAEKCREISGSNSYLSTPQQARQYAPRAMTKRIQKD